MLLNRSDGMPAKTYDFVDFADALEHFLIELQFVLIKYLKAKSEALIAFRT